MIRRIKAWVGCAAVATLLAACGGGGGSAGDTPLNPSGNEQASDLRITLSSSTLSNAGTDAVTVTITAVNAGNQAVANVPVSVTANNNAVVTVGSTVTDSAGAVTATVGLGGDNSLRTITVTAVSGSITRTSAVEVVAGSASGGASVAVVLSSQTVTSAAPATATVTLRDAGGAVVPNSVVSFSSVRGLGSFSASTALTNTAGQASVAVYPASSSTSGADEVLVSATVNGAPVTATTGFQINATTVSVASFNSDIGAGRLSAYGQANLSVALAGVAPGTPVALSISSLCMTRGKATITPTTQTTTNGTASFTYKDVGGCGSTEAVDPVQLTITGTALTSSLSLPLSSPSVSSLGFVSASPETIYLKASGFNEVSTVTFVVKDQAGNPLPAQQVVLRPTTVAGGLTLDGSTSDAGISKQSDSNGEVTVRVNSGTVPTPVRVVATLQGSSISTVSSNLSIAVGLPSQLNFSLSQGTHNIEGFNIDGTTNTYQIIASDRLGNPVPAGTAINFVTEGGQVEASKQTVLVDGLARATANFVSSSPRPENGRITVLAYALGEESFLDVNGDNVFTTGSETFQDLGDVFLSRNFTPVFNSTVDQYISLGAPGTTACAAVDASKDPLSLLGLNASTPSVGGSTCDGRWGRAYVRRAAETVLSTSTARLLFGRAGVGAPSDLPTGARLSDTCQTITLNTDNVGSQATFYLASASAHLYGLPGAGSFNLIVADANPDPDGSGSKLPRLNPMAAGTVLTASATTGISATVRGGSPVADTSDATSAVIGFEFTDASAGTIFVTATSPGGTGTTFNINVAIDAAAGTACTK
ncbi:MAG TPA: hypothetical protein VLA16_15185 [Ideonella sp.]|nr:hypothetical protein [Ideonella sp.]